MNGRKEGKRSNGRVGEKWDEGGKEGCGGKERGKGRGKGKISGG